MNFVMKASMVASACLALGVPGAALAADNSGSGQYTVAIAGQVPVICRATVDAQAVAPVAGSTSLGTLKEFCNSPTGYRVIASYSPELVKARLIVDGKPIPLDESGNAIVAESFQPGINNRQVALEVGPGGKSGWLSFRVEPF